MAFDRIALPYLESPLPIEAAKECARILVRECLVLARRPRQAGVLAKPNPDRLTFALSGCLLTGGPLKRFIERC
jgi:hypothetical protein